MLNRSLKLHHFISRVNEHCGGTTMMPKWHKVIQTKVTIQRSLCKKSSCYQTLRCGPHLFLHITPCYSRPQPLLLAWVKLFYAPGSQLPITLYPGPSLMPFHIIATSYSIKTWPSKPFPLETWKASIQVSVNDFIDKWQRWRCKCYPGVGGAAW